MKKIISNEKYDIKIFYCSECRICFESDEYTIDTYFKDDYDEDDCEYFDECPNCGREVSLKNN